jgi:hypothetical protein
MLEEAVAGLMFLRAEISLLAGGIAEIGDAVQLETVIREWSIAATHRSPSLFRYLL